MRQTKLRGCRHGGPGAPVVPIVRLVACLAPGARGWQVKLGDRRAAGQDGGSIVADPAAAGLS